MATQGVLGAATLKEFEDGLHGELIRPGDGAYDEARSIWNGAHDARPAVIARCTDSSDVRHAVGFARSEGLDVAVRGGSHSIPGFSTCDDGIVIDLSPMKGIKVDVSGRTATAEGGVTWGEFDAATQEHGLATTGGLISTTGVAGLTLGGGIGWLMRKSGLTSDNLRSAEVVTADGQILTASATRTPTSSGACAAEAATSASSPPSSSTCTRSARPWPPARSSIRATAPKRSCASTASSPASFQTS